MLNHTGGMIGTWVGTWGDPVGMLAHVCTCVYIELCVEILPVFQAPRSCHLLLVLGPHFEQQHTQELNYRD